MKLGWEKCFRIPGRKFQCILSLKCVFIREKVLIFGLLWRSDQGMEIGNLAIQVYSLHNDKVCHVNTDRSQCIFCSKKIKDIKLVIFTPIVLL